VTTRHQGLREYKYAPFLFYDSPTHRQRTVADQSQIVMPTSSSLPLGLPQVPKSLLLKLQLKEQGHGIFPIGVILGLVMLYAAHYFSSPYRKLPPGPRGYPVIGNLLDLRSGQWLKFAEWRKKYGQFILSQSSVSPF